MHNLLNEGGPYKVRNLGSDASELTIRIPTDPDGLVGRQCPSTNCSPSYFKLKLGTGVTEDDCCDAFCPYCQYKAEPNDFVTPAQREYATQIVENEALNGINRLLQDSLGFGPSRKKRINGGLYSIEMSYEPAQRRFVGRPIEEELRRDVTCPHCTLEHAVYGLATWCPDCGRDIFVTHVEAEIEVVRRMLGQVETRGETLGRRVAARDIENALEDTVSVYEAVLKFITSKYLREQHAKSEDELNDIGNKKIRNSFQSVRRGADLFRELTGSDLFEGYSESEIDELEKVFEKRHPIAHNLSIVDRKYLAKAKAGEFEGREVRVTKDEVESAVVLVSRVLNSAYARVSA